MPKTLAALPSSQYATLLDDVLGKLLDRSLPVAASASIAPSACDAPMVALLLSGWVDFHLADCRTEGREAEDRDAAMEDRIGALRHGLHTNNRLESRGAAVRSCGNAWNMDAMTAMRGGRKERCGGDVVTFLVVRQSARADWVGRITCE